MTPISPQIASDLNRASASGTAQVFSGLGVHLSSGEWLATANRYRSDCIETLKTDVAASTIDQAAIAEYIAASVPLHCLDGWTFLARALSSYASGNAHQAAHFAYYAELRAAMSILASQGIGVFNRQHFVIEQSGNARLVTGKRATHEFVWLALDHWASLANSGARLLDIFVVANATFREWFDAAPGYNVATSLALDWLKRWGLDLNAIDSDHDIRNLASYRPNAFSAWSSDGKQCSEFLRGMWALLEPSTQHFENLDTQLLRVLVDQIVLSPRSPGTPPSAQASARLTGMLNGLPIGDPERQRLRSILGASLPTPTLLTRASEPGTPQDPLIHERVMARAALLLRVSTGFCSSLIDGAAFTSADLDFWIENAGIRRAFWNPNEQPNPLTDLWIDVQDSISDENSWFTAQGTGTPDMFEWRKGRVGLIQRLSECDRVALWSLG